jgi:hypothetical protein
MKIPGEDEWRNDYGDLDVAAARRNFFGLTKDQGEILFRKNSLRYQEDIYFMPYACFEFYVHAYLDYLLSEHSLGASDGASCFFGLVECRTDDILILPIDTQKKIHRVLDKLAVSQDYFEASIEIYGSFPARASAARELIKNEPNK